MLKHINYDETTVQKIFHKCMRKDEIVQAISK